MGPAEGPAARGRKCYLCDRRRSNKIALHRFPKDPNSRSVWIAFCNLDENTDDVSNLEICSAHFNANNYSEVRAKELGGHLRLKPGSIPSILKPKSLPSTLVSPSQVIKSEIEVEEDPQLSQRMTSEGAKIEFHTDASSFILVVEDENEPADRKRIRFIEPRFVGDIQPAHMENPRIAKICLDLAKRKIAEQAKTIKVLKQRQRRLIKRVRDLEDLVPSKKKPDSRESS